MRFPFAAGPVLPAVLGAVLGTLCIGPAPVAAQTIEELQQRCEEDGNWQAKLEACTAAIASGQWTGTEIAWAHNNRGVALNLLGRFGEAEAAYTRAIGLMPAMAEAVNGRANARCRQGMVEDSLADRERAMELGAFTAEAMQTLMKAEGFYTAAIDGKFGRGSKRGLRAWTEAGCPGID